jgi:hypothetical protein
VVSSVGVIAVYIGACKDGGNTGTRDRRGFLDLSALTDEDTGDVGNSVEGAGLEFAKYDAEVT